MRLLQLVDSLQPGGAERMAVNYANSLSAEIKFSALVVTRKEGDLIKQVAKNVSYLFLDKKKTVDICAVLKLRKFIKEHKVNIIHAHSTSFFLAFLLKLILPSIKIVWHDHFGNRNKQKITDNKVLWFCSFFFSVIITVNKELWLWNKNNLKTEKVVYLPNFTVMPDEIKKTVLKGDEGKRIICVSNLHHPKNHIAIIKAFIDSRLSEENWTLHLIGKDYQDSYSDELKEYILDNNSELYIFIYGSCSDIYNVLKQSTVAILASLYEGFPVTLLEYGLSNLPVLSSNVGYCKDIIEHNYSGYLFDPRKVSEIRSYLEDICDNPSLRINFAKNLSQSVKTRFSEKGVVSQMVDIYKSLL